MITGATLHTQLLVKVIQVTIPPEIVAVAVGRVVQLSGATVIVGVVV